MDLFESLKQKISGKNISIVFPEGDDVRILGAASRLAKDGLVNPELPLMVMVIAVSQSTKMAN